ncbi:MAG: glutathione S-transferase family protein [Hyphomicrobiales bacterium]
MALEIFGPAQSNYTWAVRMAAHEKGIDATHHVVMPHTPELLAVNPTGRAPGMHHGDVTIFETSAILRYLDHTFDGPALIPGDASNAIGLEQWISYNNTTLDIWLIRRYALEFIFNAGDDGQPSPERVAEAIEKMPGIFKIVEQGVAQGFYGSDIFSVADCLVLPNLFYAQRFPHSKEAFEACPALVAYFDRMKDRECFVETMPQQSP